MSNLDQLRKEQYINIETFRKSGEGVRTPVWFVEFENQYCFTTEPGSGKVKRMKNNPAVRIAAYKMDGTVTGQWFSGTIHFMQGEEIKKMEKLFSKKYGLMKLLFELPKIFNKKPERTFIAVTLQ